MSINHSIVRVSLKYLFLSVLAMGTAYSQIGGNAGSFSRMGFGARGMGMANALTAVTYGDVTAYHNPAALPRLKEKTLSASFGFLSLDRSLNFLSYSQAVPPTAGLSAGIINSGISDIDGRDSDGEPTGPLRTWENQVFLGFGMLFKPGFSVGVNVKFYHNHLYTDVTTTSVGLDLGFLIPVNNSLTLGASIKDINSTYKWDTSVLYGQQGNKTDDKFPLLYTAGAAYLLPDSVALLAADIEASDQQTLIARVGGEAYVHHNVTLRAGIDRIDLKEKGNGLRPTFGFTARQEISGWNPALTYAYVLEPFSPSGIHMISFTLVF